MSSFHVDGRINVKMEYELAIRVGELILRSGTDDKQILALGHKLANMDEENEEFAPRWQEEAPIRQHGQFAGWSKTDWKESVPPAQVQVQERVVEKPVRQNFGTMRDKIRSRKIRWGVE